MMTKRQEILRLNRFGDAGGFELVEAPLPVPGPGEVRVRVLAAGVQFTDVVMRQEGVPDLRRSPRSSWDTTSWGRSMSWAQA